MKRSMTLVLVIAAATLAIRAQDAPPGVLQVRVWKPYSASTIPGSWDYCRG